MEIKNKLFEILEDTSENFKTIKAIEKWDFTTINNNINTIVGAVIEGLQAIVDIKDMVADIITDEQAQAELADVLDDAIKLNAVLESVDGMVFRVIIKSVCTAISPFISKEV